MLWMWQTTMFEKKSVVLVLVFAQKQKTQTHIDFGIGALQHREACWENARSEKSINQSKC